MTDFVDDLHQGIPGAIATYYGQDWLLDPGPESCADTLLAGLPDGFEARRIILTHIHFDHAGATGRLLELWPDAEVWVHERGAPHIVDPERLVSSARRLYGEQFDTLWGRVMPVPQESLKVLSGGETIDGWHVEYCPGHASHHVCYLHEPTGTAFTGDVAGVRVADGPTLPPTPPPDIDIEKWQASIQTVRSWEPVELAITHFGTFTDVNDQLDEVSENLTRFGELARTTDADAFGQQIIDFVKAATDVETTRASYWRANPPETTWSGLDRYWRKRAERG